MRWYAVQTYTGREEELVKMVRRTVPKEWCGECFVPYFEHLHCWHRQNQICVLRLFPGYLFLSSDDIERLFLILKRMPAMAKIMTAGAFEFAPLYEEEAEFLLRVMDRDRIVRLTYAGTDGRGHVTCLSGPLEKCGGHILDYRFRKRYAQVRLTIGGQEKTVRMGIILNDDVRRETGYGKVEARIRTPERYEIPASGKPPAGLKPGDRIAVLEGAFEGNTAVVGGIKDGKIRVSVHMFGRDLSVEVPAASVRKLE